MTFLRKVAKVGGAGLVVATTGGAGAATALALMKKVNGTTYTIDRWGPVKEAGQGNMINVHYSPSVAVDTSDKVTISGTPFDGVYDVKRTRTRNDIWIRPNVEVTTDGTGSATMRVKTTVQARLRHLGDSVVAETRTGAKKTGNVIKGAANWWWSKVKKALIILFALFFLYFIIKTVIQAKITKAVS